MVSALWKACSDGHIESVHELLKDASSIDIEIKDHNGFTPLVEALKNGHVEVVKVLVDKGADSIHCWGQAFPEHYTSDPAILELLNRAPNKIAPPKIPNHEQGYPHDHLADSEKRYYAPQPIPYAYYPGINPGVPPMHDGGIYYPPHLPTGEHQVQGGPPNLPPPEVARLIPCRFYPACRYGASCLFAHPQGPYFPGPLPPPAQYPAPYDPMVAQSYAHGYYPVPPPSFQPNGIHSHVSPTSPQSGVHHTPSPIGHARSGSGMLSPQSHFSPSNVPPYGVMPPVSPTYPHSGQVPVPISIPHPPVQRQPPPGPQSPQAFYAPTSPSSAFAVRQDAPAQYPPPATNTPSTFGEVNGGTKSPPPRSQPDGYSPGTGPVYRENVGGNNRRGNARRGSFGGRKPPCLFYPSGRCKNGDDCRFPHVLPEGHPPGNFPGRNGVRARGGHANTNGFGPIEEKLEGVTVKDDSQSRTANGADGSSRSHSTEPGNRGRPSQGPKNHHVMNGTRINKKPSVKQRVPNADEFPVLAGSTTPPSRSPGPNSTLTNGYVYPGPTAAQVLQAPAPLRKEAGTHSGSPEPLRPMKDSKTVEPNGVTPDMSHDSPPLKPT